MELWMIIFRQNVSLTLWTSLCVSVADGPTASSQMKSPERRSNREMTARCELREVGRHSKRDKEDEKEEACEKRGWKVTSVSKGCCCEQQLLWVTISKSWEKDRKRSIVRAKHKTCTRKTKPLVLRSCCFKVNIALPLLGKIKNKILHVVKLESPTAVCMWYAKFRFVLLFEPELIEFFFAIWEQGNKPQTPHWHIQKVMVSKQMLIHTSSRLRAAEYSLVFFHVHEMNANPIFSPSSSFKSSPTPEGNVLLLKAPIYSPANH